MLKKSSLKQKGFTLIELLVAMAIAAVLLTAIVTIFRTSVHMNSNIDNQTNATNQLKNAFNYIDRDAEEAGSVVPTTPNQFPLTLKWIQNNMDETIIYSISNSGLLQRYQYQSGVLQSTMNVANYVNTNSAKTNCTWDNTNDVLTVNMTVSIGTINTSRQFVITPRVVQGAISLATSATTMSATPSPSGFGQSVTFTAIVTGSSGTPTGIVTFVDNGTTQLGSGNLSGGQASYSTSSLSQGNYSITAVYSGDAQYNQSTSNPWTQTVNQASSSATVTSSSNPSTYGSAVTFTATVAPNAATGTVQFSIDGTNYGSPVTLGGGSASSGPISSLGGGNHTIKAVYSGDTNDAGSTSSGLIQTVSKASSSTVVSSSANPSAYGQSVTFTATVSPSGATGTVQFSIDGTPFGTLVTLSGGSAQSGSINTLSVGNHTIKAVYNGDTNDNGSTSTGLTQNVTTVTATFSPTSGPTGTNITVTGSGWALSDSISGVTVGGTTATNTLAVNSNGSLSGTITIPPVGAGAKVIIITGNLTGAKTLGNFTVTTAGATFTPTSGPVGTSIGVTGTSWATATDNSISVTVGGISATDTLSVNSSGAISGRITVPSGATPGATTIIITAAISGTQTFTSAFTVTTAAASFNPNSGPVGTIITVAGSGWPLSDSNYNVTVGGTAATDSLTANSSGVLSGTITVPSVTTGNQSISIIEALSGAQILSTNFTVTTAGAAFTPTSGTVGTNIGVTGTGWATATDNSISVTVGGISATDTLSVNSSGAISGNITVPSVSVGLQNIIITGSISGAQIFNNAFTVIAAPTISSFTPTTGGTNTSVTITGTNFTGATVVRFGGTAAASYTVNSGTQITAVVGSGTTGTISVVTPGGTANSSGTFTFVAAPTISSFTPTTGGTNTSVTITGTNFTGATVVRFGGTAAASYTVNSGTQITAVVGSGTTGTISVVTPGGTANSSGTFTFVAAPTISSFTPTTGGINTSVTITGTNFTGTTTVSFGGTAAASYTVNSGTQITAVVGSGTTGTISVVTPGGTATSGGTFTFTYPVPTISSFTPTTGGINTSVTITGTNFTGTTTVSFGGTAAASYTVNSGTQITAVVGGGSTGTVKVVTPGGTATSSGTFTFTHATPTVTNIGQNNSTTSSNNISVTVPSGGVAVGNTIIVSFAMNPATAGAVSVTDTKGNSYTFNADVSESGGSNGNIRTIIFSAPVTTALVSGNTITVSCPTVTCKAVSICYVSGLLSVSTVDQASIGTGTNNSPSSGSVTTTQASEILIGAIGGAYHGTTTFTAGTGFTALTSALADSGSSSTSANIQPEYEIVTSIGSYNATGSLSTSRDWATAIVTYKTK